MNDAAPRTEDFVGRLFFLLHDCRVALRDLQVPGADTDGVEVRAERMVFLTVVRTIETGLLHTAAESVIVLRQVSKPLGVMGGAGLEQQEL